MSEVGERRTLLIEIGCEDLPSALTAGGGIFCVELSDRLRCDGFLKKEAKEADAVSFLTPRRIATKMCGVATRQPAQTVERKGPPVPQIDENDPKVRGFAKSCGVEVNQLELRGGRLFCHAKTGGRTLAEALSEWLAPVLNLVPFPGRMRWGAGKHAFIRPVRWLCVLHGDEVIDCELFGVKSGRVTRGHRYHCPNDLELKSADEYEAVLKSQGHVIVNFTERSNRIERQVGQAGHGLLIEETTAATEWPQALTAAFDREFLSLPREVITQTLEHTLKVFPKKDKDGNLLPEFTIIADIESADPQTIVRGYENVVRARLEDAKFFFEQDKQTSLEARRPMLARTQFQEKLGTLGDKARRLEKLAAFLAPYCKASLEHTKRAAQLCKCDLDTSLVGEYPELQGIMGGYYAEADGEDEAVARAIREHYLPQGRDDMPASPEGAALALADKADTLAGFWSVGLTPSGSKDPYGLRRAANGILRILINREIDLDVKTLIGEAASGYGGGFNEDLCSYMREQLCSHVFVGSFDQHQNKTHDCVNAVASVVLRMEGLPPSDFFRRLDAVHSFLIDPAADSLIAANKRIRNILAKVEVNAAPPDADAMTEDAERDLFKAVEARRKTFDGQFDAQNYLGAMKTLAELREPIDRFFDKVLVMSENEAERNNRLALLADVRTLFLKIADFSELNPNQPEAKT